MDDEQSEEWPATDWDESASDAAAAKADGPDEKAQASSEDTPTEDNDSASEVENDGAADGDDTSADADSDEAEAQGDSETGATPSATRQPARLGRCRFGLRQSLHFKVKRSLNFRSVSTAVGWNRPR